MFEALSEAASEELLTTVLAFRESYEGYTKPDDVNRLLELFPKVAMRDGYVLDYVQEESKDGVMMPIRPFARPSDERGWVPLFDAGEAPTREDLVDQLYDYVEFEGSAEGLFQYAFFVIELWAVRVSRHAAEWAESTPIFTAERFDRFVDEAQKVSDLCRPEHYGPLSRLDEGGGGRVRFLVHTPVGWERIYYLESMVFSDGFVDQEAGEIVADMGMGQIF